MRFINADFSNFASSAYALCSQYDLCFLHEREQGKLPEKEELVLGAAIDFIHLHFDRPVIEGVESREFLWTEPCSQLFEGVESEAVVESFVVSHLDNPEDALSHFRVIPRHRPRVAVLIPPCVREAGFVWASASLVLDAVDRLHYFDSRSMQELKNTAPRITPAIT